MTVTNTDSKSTNTAIAGSVLTPVFLRIPLEHIVLLKFILESYEGLGILRTLRRDITDPAISPADSGSPANTADSSPSNLNTGTWADVVILALEDTLPELRGLLDSIKEELNFQQLTYDDQSIPDLSEDWLLADEDGSPLQLPLK